LGTGLEANGREAAAYVIAGQKLHYLRVGMQDGVNASKARLQHIRNNRMGFIMD